MSRWHKSNEAKLQFLTGNVYRRVPLFKEPEFCQLALASLDHCRRKHGIEVYGYVLMPDHFHLLIGIPHQGALQSFLREWKGFTARSIVSDLQRNGSAQLLQKFQVHNVRRRKDARYHVFQPDTYIEGISSRRFMEQKIKYIHNNPVTAGLVKEPTDYRYSSVRSWVCNDDSLFRIDRLEL